MAEERFTMEMAHQIENVPYIKVPNGMCSPGSVAIVLQNMGYEISPENIKDMGFEVLEEMDPLFKKYNGKYQRVEDPKVLLDKIANDTPIPVRIIPEGQTMRHSFVVIGYDMKKQAITIHDPVVGPNIEIPYYNFMKAWNRTGRGAIIYDKKV